MGWTDIVGSKVGNLLHNSSQPLLNQLRRSHSLPPQSSQGDESDDSKPSCSGTEFQGPDTSSLTAFIYSFLSSSRRDVASTGDGCSSWESSPKETPRNPSEDPGDADWFVVSANDLDRSIMEDYMSSHVETPKLPPMSENSCLLSEAFRAVLYPSLPTIVHGRHWVLLYSTARDGISLLTLYRKSSLLPGPCLLVAGDTKGAVFGGLLLAPLKQSRKKYQGSNQSFVFTDVSGQPKVFPATGLNRYFFLCTNDGLAIGGGGHFALYLESDLLSGSSGACETFGSSCLAHTEEFQLKDVELWGFAHYSKYISSPRP